MPDVAAADRRRAQVGKRCGSRADEDDAALDLVVGNCPGKHLRGGQMAARLRPGKMDAKPRVTISGDFDIADLQGDDACPGAEAGRA